jgi:hypothetical protein
VNFEPFCGNTKLVERPGSRGEYLPRRGAKKREEKLAGNSSLMKGAYPKFYPLQKYKSLL